MGHRPYPNLDRARRRARRGRRLWAAPNPRVVCTLVLPRPPAATADRLAEVAASLKTIRPRTQV